MARIADKDREQITKLGAQLQRDVSIDFFTQRQSVLYVPGVVACETCTVTEEVLTELKAMIPKLHVRTHDMVADREIAQRRGIDRLPTIVFGNGDAGRAKFVGAPLGYEFASFFSAVLDAGGGSTVASQTALDRIAALTKPVNLKVFVTPT